MHFYAISINYHAQCAPTLALCTPRPYSRTPALSLGTSTLYTFLRSALLSSFSISTPTQAVFDNFVLFRPEITYTVFHADIIYIVFRPDITDTVFLSITDTLFRLKITYFHPNIACNVSRPDITYTVFRSDITYCVLLK